MVITRRSHSTLAVSGSFYRPRCNCFTSPAILVCTDLRSSPSSWRSAGVRADEVHVSSCPCPSPVLLVYWQVASTFLPISSKSVHFSAGTLG
ncbi:hypothetical protein RRG08_023741 [Elysia crispata]|uniref:Uncharacterized protein n=1 Tax=Elysia crispata TaxID=231223 RepID=A0AAE0ZW10_9GAST|nr:hypothetical protein RRG08_023741 [Elysia crispata]